MSPTQNTHMAVYGCDDTTVNTSSATVWEHCSFFRLACWALHGSRRCDCLNSESTPRALLSELGRLRVQCTLCTVHGLCTCPHAALPSQCSYHVGNCLHAAALAWRHCLCDYKAMHLGRMHLHSLPCSLAFFQCMIIVVNTSRRRRIKPGVLSRVRSPNYSFLTMPCHRLNITGVGSYSVSELEPPPLSPAWPWTRSN